jgi:RimJ/RimL family protein N-acetyltransferase
LEKSALQHDRVNFMIGENDILHKLNIKVYTCEDYKLLTKEELNEFTSIYQESLDGIAKFELKQKGKHNYTDEEYKQQLDQSRQGFNNFWSEFFTKSDYEEKFAVVAMSDDNKKLSAARFIKNKFTEWQWLIEAVETHPSFRRLGISKEVIKEGISYIKHNYRDDCIVISNIYNFNTQSIKLHQSLGFRVSSDKPTDSYGEFDDRDIRYQLNIQRES